MRTWVPAWRYLGFPGTLGADCIDYLIADAHVIPRTEDDLPRPDHRGCLRVTCTRDVGRPSEGPLDAAALQSRRPQPLSKA